MTANYPTISKRARSPITACRSRESSRSRRPSRSATSATWRSPIRPASPPPARRSPPIRRRPRDYTARANLVGVISNGTAVLGLGNIGPLAAKPVMEGKAVLFKKFAGIDVFDIEIDAEDVDRIVDVVAALEPTFGGINLEDIKAPECFEVEAQLQARMRSRCSTTTSTAPRSSSPPRCSTGWNSQARASSDVKIVTSGAGAAALACLNLLVSLGARRENIWVTDIEGVVYEGRADADGPLEGASTRRTPTARTLAEVIAGADIFLGLSARRRAEAGDG